MKCKGKKLSNFPKEKKERDFLGQKGNKLGLNLKRKTGVFRAKNWEKFEYTGQKLDNLKKKKKLQLTDFKEKKDISGQKNKLGLSLRRKNDSQGNKKNYYSQGNETSIIPKAIS